jgi:hypothetical protein
VQGTDWFTPDGPVKGSEIREAIVRSTEDNFGFTPTFKETNELERLLRKVYRGDMVHKFMTDRCQPRIGATMPLHQVWDRWRAWKQRDKIPEATLRERLMECGYVVFKDAIIGWELKPTDYVKVADRPPAAKAEAYHWPEAGSECPKRAF